MKSRKKTKWVHAERLVKEHGKKLIGKIIDTEPLGGWPGGLAVIVDCHIKNYGSNIVMIVKGDQKDRNGKKFSETGLFGYELVLLTKLKSLKGK